MATKNGYLPTTTGPEMAVLPVLMVLSSIPVATSARTACRIIERRLEEAQLEQQQHLQKASISCSARVSCLNGQS